MAFLGSCILASKLATAELYRPVTNGAGLHHKRERLQPTHPLTLLRCHLPSHPIRSCLHHQVDGGT